MQTTLYLIRHADSTYTIDERNRPISEKGKEDVNRLRKLFNHIHIDKIYSSPYKRAIQTVEGIAFERNLEIDLVEDMRERTKTQGKLDNFFENVKKLWEKPSFNFEGGESNIEAQTRGIKALNNLLDENMGKSFVIASHGDIMSLMLNHYDSEYEYNFWRQLDMPDAYALVFENSNLQSIKQVWSREKPISPKIK